MSEGLVLGGTPNTSRVSRSVNIELLRIVSILMIVMSHMMNVWAGGVLREVDLFSANYFIGWLIDSCVVVAVNCFVLISGYFLVNQPFRLKRLILLWVQMVFYSVGIYLLFVLLGDADFSPTAFIKCFFPISTSSLWFITDYFLLCCVSPFLNLAISGMTKKQHRNALIVLCLIFSVWATLAGFGDFSGVNQGFSLSWFVTLYLIAAYLRRYYTPKGASHKWMLCFLATCVLLAATKPFITVVTSALLGEPAYSGAFFIYNSPFVLAAAVFLFLFFLNVKITGKRAGGIICFLAPLSLGVQIIHADPHIGAIWIDLLRPYEFANSPWMVPYLIFCTLAVYGVCAAIEAIRRSAFQPLNHIRWPDRLMNSMVEKLDKISE